MYASCKQNSYVNFSKNLLQAVTGLSASFARAQVVDFTFKVQPPSFDKLLIANPLGGLNYMAYIEPLHYSAWYGIGLFVILTPPFLYLTTR